jgi:hypothetical protein
VPRAGRAGVSVPGAVGVRLSTDLPGAQRVPGWDSSRPAAKNALAGFPGGRLLKANQIDFMNLIVDHLSEHGIMPASLLYESPVTDLAPSRPGGLS